MEKDKMLVFVCMSAWTMESDTEVAIKKQRKRQRKRKRQRGMEEKKA